ncbi:hypothetical protein Vadar_010853 [Vaccinium darrowii]|uniref:Uncharacterized protein n=1 Tax=Vaccinium darrowii TaxID=229202 RepID=A0ACB7YD54_9ERIC|nr:hypothetical protein Vadar_010853 [Vaccinium darrowii]
MIKIHEAQTFSSMPVGIRSKTPNKSSNLKRQRWRRNKAPKKVEQESVTTNVMVAIEKALGDYNDDFEPSTESTTGSLVESELNSSEVESESQRNVSTNTEEQFVELIKTGREICYLNIYASGELSSSTKSEPRSVTKVVSVMMADVNDEEQSLNSQQNQQLLEEKVASLQEQLKKRDKEMSMEQIKGLLAQGKQKHMHPQEDHLNHRKQCLLGGNGHFFVDPTNGNMNPILMAVIDDMVKNQVKRAKEKDDEGFQMITKPCSAWVDTVPFPPGMGDPRHHIAHFLSRCGPIAQNEALCLQLFVQSLEGSAFTWYSNLPEAAAVETKKRGPIVVGVQKPKETEKATMKERLEKNYSFINYLVDDMFEDLLEKS